MEILHIIVYILYKVEVFYFMSKSYDDISKSLLMELFELSDLVLRMGELNNQLLMNRKLNCNFEFQQYLKKFDMGRFYHFRCQGYMEALVLTKCYNEASLCYWKNKLFTPALESFMSALENIDNLKIYPRFACNPTFRELLKIIDELKALAMEIQMTIREYGLHC